MRPTGRDLGAGLGEAEDVVDEQEHVLALLVAVVLGGGQGRDGHPGAGAGGLGHLAVDEGGLVDDPGLLHFVIEVVALAGALAHPGEDADAAVLHGDVVDHLHHDHGLAHPGAAEHAHLAAAGEGDQKVDDLDPGFQDVDRGVLVGQGGGGAVDGVVVLGVDRSQAVHRPADHVEHPAQGLVAHRHLDGLFGVLDRKSPAQALGDVHGDAADGVVAQVLGHLHHQVVFLVVDGLVGDEQGGEDGGQRALELHVHHRPDDLLDPADLH